MSIPIFASQSCANCRRGQCPPGSAGLHFGFAGFLAYPPNLNQDAAQECAARLVHAPIIRIHKAQWSTGEIQANTEQCAQTALCCNASAGSAPQHRRVLPVWFMLPRFAYGHCPPRARPSVPKYSAETRDTPPLIMVRSELPARAPRRSTGVCCTFGSCSHNPHIQSPMANRRRHFGMQRYNYLAATSDDSGTQLGDDEVVKNLSKKYFVNIYFYLSGFTASSSPKGVLKLYHLATIFYISIRTMGAHLRANRREESLYRKIRSVGALL